jgi:hypothetical protein
MTGLQIELAPVVRVLPTGNRVQDAEVAGDGGEAGEQDVRQDDAAGALAQIDVGRVPGGVFGVPGVEVAGGSLKVDKDASPGSGTDPHRRGVGLGLAAAGQGQEGAGSGQELAACQGHGETPLSPQRHQDTKITKEMEWFSLWFWCLGVFVVNCIDFTG